MKGFAMHRGLGIVLLMSALLSSCSNENRRYCKAEKRIIPELEWKARALVALQKKLEVTKTDELDPEFPEYLKELLARKLPNGGTDSEKQALFIQYMEKHPLCCQVDYTDHGGWISAYIDIEGSTLYNPDGPLNATFYLFDGNESDVPTLRELFQPGNQLPDHVGLSFFGVTACGNEVIFWDRG